MVRRWSAYIHCGSVAMQELVDRPSELRKAAVKAQLYAATVPGTLWQRMAGCVKGELALTVEQWVMYCTWYSPGSTVGYTFLTDFGDRERCADLVCCTVHIWY